ncbi:MAG: uroporphyrinogen decarboxylase [Bacteroidota bacterium]
MELKNDLLIRAARGLEVERPPVWLMRQAGRILPQYRELRAKVDGFKQLVETPELACEVTLQPVDEIGVDAAIIFSDILVIPEAMGLPYEMIPGKGPMFPMTVITEDDVNRLSSGPEAAADLIYVEKAIELVKTELDNKIPLIGFAGAPWTIMAYMIEGSGSKTFSKARKFLYTLPELSHALLDKITNTTIAYLQNQINAGANIVQLFDSWAGILSPFQYQQFGIPYLQKICDAITDAPIIVFAKDAWFALPELGKLNCHVIGLDWHIHPDQGRKWVGKEKSLQGNLDPCLLYANTDTVRESTLAMLKAFGGKHIANLGHGVYPDTPLDNVKTFVETVQTYWYSNQNG